MAERFRGALIGTAVGDALGAPTEGRPRVESSYLDSLNERTNLTYTDDTAMTLGVARSLVECGGFDGPHMAKNLAEIYRREPWRGYGAGPPLVFSELARGVSWDRAAASLFGGEGSYGNGAAMRVAPVALFAFPDTQLTARLAQQTAIITHIHEEGVDGAVAQAVAVAVLLDASPPIEPSDIVSAVLGHVSTPVFRDKLEFLGRNIARRTTSEMAEVLGSGIAAHASVVTALACFLEHPGSFSDAVKAAIGLGGDTDTVAAMTGALSGSYLGIGAIPESWREVEDADELVSLADAVYSRAPRE